MLLLTSTTDKVQVVTGQAVTVDVHASYMDYNGTTVTPDRKNTNISTATTTDVVASPGASVSRNVKLLIVRNRHASSSCDVTVQHTDGTTVSELYKTTLTAGQTLVFLEGTGFFVLPASTTSANLTVAEGSFNQRTLSSELPPVAVGTFLIISGTAYYVYVGRIVADITVVSVEFHVTTAGAGAQTAEVGLFSSTNPPNKSAQTLTKIAATGTVDSLTTTGMKRNTASFAQAVSKGTHLWAAFRTAMATTQPTVAGLAGDFSEGHILTTTGGGALTGLGSAAGTIPAIATATIAPNLRVTLD